MVKAACRGPFCVTRATISDSKLYVLELGCEFAATNALQKADSQPSVFINRFPRLTIRRKIHGNYERSYQVPTDSRVPAVTRLLACHDRQPAHQRDGPGNGPAVSGG